MMCQWLELWANHWVPLVILIVGGVVFLLVKDAIKGARNRRPGGNGFGKAQNATPMLSLTVTLSAS